MPRGGRPSRSALRPGHGTQNSNKPSLLKAARRAEAQGRETVPGGPCILVLDGYRA